MEEHKLHGGTQVMGKHPSAACGCDMSVSVFLPPQYGEAEGTKAVPVIIYLSGLTCTDANATQKSGIQRFAAKHGIAVVFPDTSPRGLGVDGESETWDFGVGAGFYLNASVPKWKNWRMYDYITRDLPNWLGETYRNIDMSSVGLMGHSMGGHGALTIFLKNPGKYKSVSAFSPICNPIECTMGQKCLAGYLGPKEGGGWEEYDATELAKKYDGPPVHLFLDVGTSDEFLVDQLKPENLKQVVDCKDNIDMALAYRQGYDHSYYYIATHVEEHLEYHAKALL